jgi:hypothetical protein
VACISCTTETKSIIERIFVMKDEQEKIDLLLERNTDEQLKNVDWDKLSSVISSRLDKAQKDNASKRKYPSVFRIAAGIAVAAAVILITFMITLEKPADIQSGVGRNAMVEFIDGKGSASIVILDSPSRAHVKVDVVGMDKRVANCYVQIIESSAGQREKGNIQPSWFIICRSEYVNGNHGINSDIMDVLYLF